jgi:hypothetical protein
MSGLARQVSGRVCFVACATEHLKAGRPTVPIRNRRHTLGHRAPASLEPHQPPPSRPRRLSIAHPSRHLPTSTRRSTPTLCRPNTRWDLNTNVVFTDRASHRKAAHPPAMGGITRMDLPEARGRMTLDGVLSNTMSDGGNCRADMARRRWLLGSWPAGVGSWPRESPCEEDGQTNTKRRDRGQTRPSVIFFPRSLPYSPFVPASRSLFPLGQLAPPAPTTDRLLSR